MIVVIYVMIYDLIMITMLSNIILLIVMILIYQIT